MKHRDKSGFTRPQISQLLPEIDLNLKKKENWSVIGNLIFILTAAAVAVLVAILALPILRIYGFSMSPTLQEGDYVLSVKTGEFQTVDLVVFYRGNNVLVKRYIAGPGQWVNIDGILRGNEDRRMAKKSEYRRRRSGGPWQRRLLLLWCSALPMRGSSLPSPWRRKQPAVCRSIPMGMPALHRNRF